MTLRDASTILVMALCSTLGAGCASTAAMAASETASPAGIVPLADAQLARICGTDPTVCAAEASLAPAAAVRHPSPRGSAVFPSPAATTVSTPAAPTTTRPARRGSAHMAFLTAHADKR